MFLEMESKMLRLIAERCTEILLQHGTIQEDKRAIYIYGFELFWSTSFSMLSILLLGGIFGYLGQAVVFLLCFVPIRTAAGGYHAKSYGGCFLVTNFTAIFCVVVSGRLYLRSSLWGERLLWILLVLAFLYIWMNAPVNSAKHPLKPDRVIKNRRYARIILGIEAGAILIADIWFDHSAIYTAIVTTCVVAVMIIAAEKGGERNECSLDDGSRFYS